MTSPPSRKRYYYKNRERILAYHREYRRTKYRDELEMQRRQIEIADRNLKEATEVEEMLEKYND